MQAFAGLQITLGQGVDGLDGGVVGDAGVFEIHHYVVRVIFRIEQILEITHRGKEQRLLQFVNLAAEIVQPA